MLPSLGIGLQLDDYIHRHILTGASFSADLPRSRLDIFAFLDGDPVRTRRLIDLGLVPWWTLETVRVAFWRPVSALTHWVDYLLWPERPALMHLQSILWYGGLVAAVAALYRRVMPGTWAAGLAALLYAVDGAHGLPAGWLANRNATIGAVFGVLALVAHDRWRRDRWHPGAIVGPVLLLAALLSAEATVAIGGYLVAHAVFLDRSRPRERLLALLPCAMVTVGWHLVYRLLGYGAWGATPYYMNPLAEPGRFGRAVVEQGPLMLLAQWVLPFDLAARLFTSGRALWLTALVALTLLSVALWPLLRRSGAARFWALGQALAAVPLCASVPHDRHLLLVGIGTMGLLAVFAAGILERSAWVPMVAAWRVPAMALAGALLGLHAIVAPLRLPVTSRGFEFIDGLLRDSADSIPDDPGVPGHTLVLVDPPDASRASFLHFYRLASGRPVPARIYRLASGLAPMELSRPDARTLVVRSADGFFPAPQDRVFRGEGFPMATGQRVRLTGLTAEVTQIIGDGLPAEVAFRFDVPLEDPSLRWLAWRRELGSVRYASFQLPRVGESLRLP